MKITVLNFTSSPLSAHLVGGLGFNVDPTPLPPHSSTPILPNTGVPVSRNPFACTGAWIRASAALELRGGESDAEAKTGDAYATCSISYNTLAFRARQYGWAAVKVKEGGQGPRWKVYLSRDIGVGSGNGCKVFVLPKRDMSSFMKDIEDTRPLSDVVLPSTHETLSRYGWPISQCQAVSTPYADQLRAGIRVFDIRMSVVNGRLIAHHSIMPERTPFLDVLTDTHAFLTDPATSSETIVMSIKQEDFNTTPPATFSQIVHEELFGGPGGREMWFLEDRLPTLGEVRGKVIMLSRFGGDGSGWEGGLAGMGIHPTTWPDSAENGFTWTLNETLVRTSDWYNIGSFTKIPEKFGLATGVLMPPSGGYTQPTLNVAFFSAGSFPLAMPPVVAKGFGFPAWKLGVEGVNERLGKWLLDTLAAAMGESGAAQPVPRGWVFMDFFKKPEGLPELLVECNFLTGGEPGSPAKAG